MNASKARRRIASVALAVALLVALAAPVTAAPQRIDWSGVFYPCGGAEGTEFVTKNTLHFRGFRNDNLWVTDTPLLNGREVNFVNGDINLTTGRGVAHPRSTVSPDAVDGTWEIQITVHVTPDGLTGHGVGRGTGDLHGMTLFFNNPGDIAIDPADNPCSDLPFAVLIEGAILAPRGTP